MSLYFDNNKLFDAEGHLTDEGLYAIKDGTLADLGALEAAEHLSFCDYSLLRYSALFVAAPDCMKQPMRDLIPQVQSLMRLRSFRIMTNRYVSAAAAVVLGFVMWGAVSAFGVPDAAALLTEGQWSERLLHAGGLGLPLVAAYTSAKGWALTVGEGPGMSLQFTLPAAPPLDGMVLTSPTEWRADRQNRRRLIRRELAVLVADTSMH